MQTNWKTWPEAVRKRLEVFRPGRIRLWRKRALSSAHCRSLLRDNERQSAADSRPYTRRRSKVRSFADSCRLSRLTEQGAEGYLHFRVVFDLEDSLSHSNPTTIEDEDEEDEDDDCRQTIGTQLEYISQATRSTIDPTPIQWSGWQLRH